MATEGVKILMISFVILIVASCSAGFSVGFKVFDFATGGSGSFIRVNSDTEINTDMNLEVFTIKYGRR